MLKSLLLRTKTYARHEFRTTLIPLVPMLSIGISLLSVVCTFLSVPLLFKRGETPCCLRGALG